MAHQHGNWTQAQQIELVPSLSNPMCFTEELRAAQKQAKFENQLYTDNPRGSKRGRNQWDDKYYWYEEDPGQADGAAPAGGGGAAGGAVDGAAAPAPANGPPPRARGYWVKGQPKGKGRGKGRGKGKGKGARRRTW